MNFIKVSDVPSPSDSGELEQPPAATAPPPPTAAAAATPTTIAATALRSQLFVRRQLLVGRCRRGSRRHSRRPALSRLFHFHVRMVLISPYIPEKWDSPPPHHHHWFQFHSILISRDDILYNYPNLPLNDVQRCPLKLCNFIQLQYSWTVGYL